MEASFSMVELGAPCGVYCGACKFYLTEKCGGCRAKRNEQCTIWKCAEERGLRFCGECDRFPCENNYATPALAKQWLDEVKEAFQSKK